MSTTDPFLDGLLKNTRTCTHTHSCNPPGPDYQHTHTCYHTHTQLLPSEDQDLVPIKLKPRRPLGNREAVRKYREKKKAHTAYLEEEVKKLRLVNQQLVRKLQGQDFMEKEVLRLRGLLLDLRGMIDKELGVSPFQKQCNVGSSYGNSEEGNCGEVGLSCEDDRLCFHANGGSGKMVVSYEGNCESAIVDCQADRNDIVSEKGRGLMSSALQDD